MATGAHGSNGSTTVTLQGCTFNNFVVVLVAPFDTPASGARCQKTYKAND
jgi:hypothetical protein